MRILVLLTDAFGGCGGIAKFNRDLLTALCAEQAHPEVIAIPRLIPGNTDALPHRLIWMTEASRGKLQYLRAVWRSVSDRGRGPVGRRGFDLILCAHINLLPIAWLACALARRHAMLAGRKRTPRPLLALIAHGTEAWHPRRLRASRIFLKHLDGIVCVSEFTRKRLFGWSGLEEGKPSFVVPNSIELSQFRPGRKDDSLAERYGVVGRRVLLTLARLHPAERYKGIEQVFEVMPRLNAQIPGLCYLVAGEGADRARLAAKARSLGLAVSDFAETARSPGGPEAGTEQARVIFCGSIPEVEKAEHYRLADAFVMPGWGEGFGIVYLEALACGIPVVGSELDASGEVLAGCDIAFVVDPREPAEVYQGIRRALEARRGVVPDRVREFSTENFRQRAHRMIDELGRMGAGGCEETAETVQSPSGSISPH